MKQTVDRLGEKKTAIVNAFFCFPAEYCGTVLLSKCKLTSQHVTRVGDWLWNEKLNFI